MQKSFAKLAGWSRNGTTPSEPQSRALAGISGSGLGTDFVCLSGVDARFEARF